jgi:hypothetical protein
MSKHKKIQIGKGGCFSTPEELKGVNKRLQRVTESLSGSLTPEENKELEKELYELLNDVEIQMNNNSNNATKKKQKQNNATKRKQKQNNNAIKRQLGVSDEEFAALSKELEGLEGKVL